MHIYLKRLIFFLLLITVIYSCAQTKGLIRKTNAYSYIKLPGTIQKTEDDLGKLKQEIVLLVYAETKSNKIVWDSAWFDNKVYKLIPQLSQEGSFEVGFEKNSEKKIILKADSGYYLYQLYLQPSELKVPFPAKYQEGKILLKGKYKDKQFYWLQNAPVEIRTYDAM